jgi:hypothetical protein
LLGNIMHNATASVDEQPTADLRWDERVVVTCRTCGAPQQTGRVGSCPFCGGDLFKTTEIDP